MPPPRIIRFYRWLWRFWKQRRFERFITCMQPQPGDRLLDIGGYPFNWFHKGMVVEQVDVLNLQPVETNDIPANSPIIRCLTGDGRHLDFKDASYDIIFSNSVIEHVGTLDDQMAFATEARRVGAKLWIQTPAHGCPIEPHFMGLFIHWFPRCWHAKLARWFSIRGLSSATHSSDLKTIADNTRLLSKAEMQELFPDCLIWTERMLGILPKSHVAIRGNKQRRR